MPPMELVRQSAETHTNGDVESEVKTPEDSPQHINNDSVSVHCVFRLCKSGFVERSSGSVGRFRGHASSATTGHHDNHD